MTTERLPKDEYRAKRRAERAEAKVAAAHVLAACRHCGRPLAADGVCSPCYLRGKR